MYRLHLQDQKLTEKEAGLQLVARQIYLPVHIRTARRYILADGNIHNYRCKILKSYKMFFSFL
jgi:hypothetical protein